MTPLFARLLGEDAFAALPGAVRRLHEGGDFAGEAQVEGPEGLLARIVAGVVGFPAAGGRVAVRVRITPQAGCENWDRDFGGRRFRSRMMLARRGLQERFGPFVFDVAVPADAAGLRVVVRGWRVFGLPLPLAPMGDAVESADADGRFRFDVVVRLPLGLGRVVRYRGWLEPA